MKTLRQICRILLAASMIVMTLAVALGVVARYGFNKPLLWTDEIARASLVWLTFVGAAQLFSYQNGHLKLTYFTDKMIGPTRRASAIVTNAVELVLVVIVGLGGVVLIHFNTDAVTSSLEIPVYLLYGIIPLSSLAAAYFIIRKLAAEISGENLELAGKPLDQDPL